MWLFIFVLFALALFGGGIFGRLLGLITRIAFVLILAGMFTHP